jgi:sulfite oxidase
VPLGSVALNTEILRPDDGCRLRPGPTEVSGYAYAGDDRDVARVDVSLDGGSTWVQADLDAPQGRWAWRLWRTVLDLPAGEARITVRAWDTTGATQPACPEQVWNPKGYVNNSWAEVSLTVG